MNEPRVGTSYTVPRFHGRHRSRGNVLWFDGHASSEPVVPVPPGVSFMVGSGTGVQPRLPEDYARVNLGYLTRPKEDFNSPDINYYFFINKEKRTLRMPR